MLICRCSGIAETVCVLFFASALGRWLDSTSSRLHGLLMTIITNRVIVLLSCLMWFLILSFDDPAFKKSFFAIALVLGMIEKLSRGTNILSMERDWIPTLANPTIDATIKSSYNLTHLNTVMRRIDMLCKLIAPLAVSTFLSSAGSERMMVTAVAIISILSWGPEIWCIQQVWKLNGRLKVPKRPIDDTSNGIELDNMVQHPYNGFAKVSPKPRFLAIIQKITSETKNSIDAHMEGLRYYFSTFVWIPSICAAIPHASVLTFSGTMITYLLNAGFNLNYITAAKASGAVFEISSTLVFPWAVGVLSRPRVGGEYQSVQMQESLPGNYGADVDDEEPVIEAKKNASNTERGVVRVGWWALCGFFLSLVGDYPILLGMDFFKSLTDLLRFPLRSPSSTWILFSTVRTTLNLKNLPPPAP